MKQALAAITLAALAAALPLSAAAQTTTRSVTTTADGGMTYPWQRNFWGYAGVSAGGTSYQDLPCVGGFSCDDNSGTFRLFAGGKVNNIFGGEIAYVNFGKANAAGGDFEAHGINLSLLAGFPLGGIGSNSSIFGKIGTTYGRTKISGTIPAVQTGTENDWGLSYGIGAQFGINDRWAVRVDADRYRLQFVNSGKQDVDTLTVGVQYRF
jgi:OOP family OmpA-OmpF porin